MPCSHGSSVSHASASCAWRHATASVFVVVLATGAADHDLVFLDRDLDRAVARPVLGVDRVVLHGGIEPQPVALLAVIERPLERALGRRAPA